MIPLDPHIVVIAEDARASAAAARLRAGGYLVTKTTVDDAQAMIAMLAPQAVVVDLPALDAMRFVKELGALTRPLLVVTTAPRLMASHCRALHRADVEGDVICAVDRMIADAA